MDAVKSESWWRFWWPTVVVILAVAVTFAVVVLRQRQLRADCEAHGMVLMSLDDVCVKGYRP